MYIGNTSDLKFAYGLLRLAELHGFDNLRDAMKADIREYNHKPQREERIVKENGIDGFVKLSPLPEFLKTIEEARDYFMEEEYRECRPSQYDCTGQAFTSWYKIFRRGGRFWAYHSIQFDV